MFASSQPPMPPASRKMKNSKSSVLDASGYTNPAEYKTAKDNFIAKTLPKHRTAPDGSMVKCEDGDEDGQIYSIFHTPVLELMDFGIGIGLYYVKLLIMASCFFVMFFILLPNMLYYNGSTYRPSTAAWPASNTFAELSTWQKTITKGSAQCSGRNQVSVQFDGFSTFSDKVFPGCKDETWVHTTPKTCAQIQEHFDDKTWDSKSADYPKLGRKEIASGRLYLGHVADPGFIGDSTGTCTNRYGISTVPTTETKFRYCAAGAMHTCPLDKSQAYYSITIFVLVIVLCLVFDEIVAYLAKEQDEEEQTAQDYSVVVMDPSPNDTNPDDWKDFFQEQCAFGEVVCVTVALNNGPLMRELARKEEIIEMIRLSDQITDPSEIVKPNPGKDMTFGRSFKQRMGCMAGLMQAVGVGRDVPYWLEQQKKCEAKIKALENGPNPGEQYTATRVFVSFNTEAGQRACLHAMSMGIIPAMRDNHEKIEAKYIREGNVLDVREAPEPTNIIYDHLHVGFFEQLSYYLLSSFLALSFVVVGYFMFEKANEVDPSFGAIMITILNSAFPEVFKIFGEFEIHHTVTSKKQSLLLKLVCARLFNTAIVTWIATPYDRTLDHRFIQSIQMILFFDFLLTPVIRFFDIFERAKQLLLAPRVKTQANMDRFFRGTKFWISERYTDLLKTSFIAMLYITINPGGVVLACLAFTMSYWVDKYMLLRRWKTPPIVSYEITITSNFYLLLSLVLSAFFSGYFYANWSYDNVCAVDKTCWLTTKSNQCILSDDQRLPTSTFITCNKLLHEKHGGMQFLWPQKEKHMTSDQVDIVEMWRILSIVAVAMFVSMRLVKPIFESISLLFYRVHDNDAEPSNVTFVDIIDDDAGDIQAYVPNYYNDKKMVFPLLMCDLTLLDPEMEVISFTTKNYFACCAYNDDSFPALKGWEDKNPGVTHPAFGVCKYYGSTQKKLSLEEEKEQRIRDKPIRKKDVQGMLEKATNKV